MDITGVADAPVVGASNVTGDEDTAIALNITAALADTDGSETLSVVTITGVPDGATLSAGTDNGSGNWTVNAVDLDGLTITPPTNSNDDFSLSVSVTATENDGDTETTVGNFDVDVVGVADEPLVHVTEVRGFDNQSEIPLDVHAYLSLDIF